MDEFLSAMAILFVTAYVAAIVVTMVVTPFAFAWHAARKWIGDYHA